MLHDLHESVKLLYVSTGTGPYNPIVDPIQVNEWWLLAQNEIMEMTKRGVPGVWTYNYYDGWVPNYMFWIGVTHNSIGRFYETQSGGVAERRASPPATSREWYRPNPGPGDVRWNPRSNVNMQQSALLITLNTSRRTRRLPRELLREEQEPVNRGKTPAPYAYVIPADQRQKSDAADLINIVRREGVDVSVASQAFKAGNADVKAGDYVVRIDQPYGGIVEMYLGLQWYPPNNPRPYDDTGWSIPLLRNVKVTRVDDKSVLDQPMTPMTANAAFAGTIQGSGSTIVIDHTTDNTLATFRLANATVKMSAAEQAFDLGGHHFAAGAFVIANANRAALEPQIQEMGLQAWATDAAPSVPMHDLTCRASATSTRGRARRTRAGSAWPSTCQDSLQVLRRQRSAAGQPARAVRRDHLSERGRADRRRGRPRRRAARPSRIGRRPRRRTSRRRPIRPTIVAAVSAATACASSRSSWRTAAC